MVTQFGPELTAPLPRLPRCHCEFPTIWSITRHVISILLVAVVHTMMFERGTNPVMLRTGMILISMWRTIEMIQGWRWASSIRRLRSYAGKTPYMTACRVIEELDWISIQIKHKVVVGQGCSQLLGILWASDWNLRDLAIFSLFLCKNCSNYSTDSTWFFRFANAILQCADCPRGGRTWSRKTWTWRETEGRETTEKGRFKQVHWRLGVKFLAHGVCNLWMLLLACKDDTNKDSISAGHSRTISSLML